MSVAVLDKNDLQEFAQTLGKEIVDKYEKERMELEAPMTQAECAEYLKISEKTLLRLCNASNAIPFGLVMSKKRFYRNDVREWLQSNHNILDFSELEQ